MVNDLHTCRDCGAKFYSSSPGHWGCPVRLEEIKARIDKNLGKLVTKRALAHRMDRAG